MQPKSRRDDINYFIPSGFRLRLIPMLFYNHFTPSVFDRMQIENDQMPFPLWILFATKISKIPQLIFRKG
jgi:hypothetical protein